MDKVEKFRHIVHGVKDSVEIVAHNCLARGDNPVGTCIDRLEREFECLKYLVDVKFNEDTINTAQTGLVFMAKYAMAASLIVGGNEIGDATALADQMTDLYARKNADYGDSFDNSMNNFGIIASIVRISDKINRAQSLVAKQGKAEVKSETLSDTFIDLACYSVMTAMWVEAQLSEIDKGEINAWNITARHMEEIPKSEAVVGDYAYTDGDSGFCHGSYNKIVGITTNYHPRTGKPFKVVVLDDEDVYRFDNGRCIEGAEAYRIISYARLKPGVVIKSDE